MQRRELQPSDFLSTGSTLLNLACTGKVHGGFAKGSYFFVVGDSVSGKTFLTLTCLAEASINKHFDDYRFIHDDVEGGALMDIERFFGKGVAERMESPAMEGDLPINSETIEDFYFHLDDAFEEGKPFIYVLDSMDALSSDYEGKKFKEKKKAARSGKQAKGDYGDGKAKINSGWIRKARSALEKTGSILVVISQTRDNVGAGLFESSKTRSGGRSLRFYATLELWSSVKGRLNKSVRGNKRQVGIVSKVEVRKNRETGRERTVEIPIYHSYGIDDVGSCIDYLVGEKHWTAKSGVIKAEEFEFEGRRNKLIRMIEQEGLQKDLRELVGEVWSEIETACELKRKGRYV